MFKARLAMWERVGHAHRNLALQVDSHGESCLADLGAVCAYVSPGQDRVDFRPCSGAEATRGSPISPATQGGCVRRFQFRVGSDVLQMPVALPLFELMDVEVSLKDGGAVIHLPAVHKLPWPSRKSFNSFPDPGASALEALEVRLGSAVASGLGNLGDNPIPGHVRAHLQPGAFMEARRTALILAGREP